MTIETIEIRLNKADLFKLVREYIAHETGLDVSDKTMECEQFKDVYTFGFVLTKT